MNKSIPEILVPSMVQTLTNLMHILKIAEAHCEANKVDPAVLLGSRLYPDMFALTRQVQIVSDNAKGAVARLSGSEPPKYEDKESSFAELGARLQKTLDYVKSVDASKYAGAESRAVEMKFPSVTFKFRDGWDYLISYAIPNTAFHYTTAYAILRHCGVKVGKGDYMGSAGRA